MDFLCTKFVNKRASELCELWAWFSSSLFSGTCYWRYADIFFSLFICFPAFCSNDINHKCLIFISLLSNCKQSAVYSLLGLSFPGTLFVFFFAVEQGDKHSGSSSHLSLKKSMHKVNSKYSSEKMLWLSKELAILNSKLQ